MGEEVKVAAKSSAQEFARSAKMGPHNADHPSQEVGGMASSAKASKDSSGKRDDDENAKAKMLRQAKERDAALSPRT